MDMGKTAWMALSAVCLLGYGCGGDDTSDPDPEPTGCTAPGTLMTREAFFEGGAADDRYVYLGDSTGRLWRIRLADGRTESIVELGAQEQIRSVALDAGTLYFGASRGPNAETGGTSRILSVASGGGQVTELASGLDLISAVAVDTTHVYWVTSGTAPGGGTFLPNGRLQRVPRGGGAVETLDTTLASAADLVLDGPDVWIAASGSATGQGHSGVFRFAKNGGPLISVGPAVTAIGLALDAGFVYHTTRDGGGAIQRVPRTGGQPDRTYGTGLNFPSAVVLVAGTLYYVGDSDNTGSVSAVAVAGGQPRMVADALNNPRSLTPTTCGLVVAAHREVRLVSTQ
jgi:hypothetical protein